MDRSFNWSFTDLRVFDRCFRLRSRRFKNWNIFDGLFSTLSILWSILLRNSALFFFFFQMDNSSLNLICIVSFTGREFAS